MVNGKKKNPTKNISWSPNKMNHATFNIIIHTTFMGLNIGKSKKKGKIYNNGKAMAMKIS